MSTQKKKGRSLNSSYQAGTILKEYWEGAARHQAEGRPVAWVSGNVPIELFWAMGVYPVYPENYSAVCASVQRAQEFCEVAEQKGFSIDLCYRGGEDAAGCLAHRSLRPVHGCE